MNSLYIYILYMRRQMRVCIRRAYILRVPIPHIPRREAEYIYIYLLIYFYVEHLPLKLSLVTNRLEVHNQQISL